MPNYNSGGGPLIPAHGAIKYGILLSDHDLTSSNIVMNETEQDDMVLMKTWCHKLWIMLIGMMIIV